MINLSAEAIIKSQARDTLKKNYVRAVIALLIVLLPYYIIDGATTILSCLFSFLISDDALRSAVIYSFGYTVEILAFFFFSPVLNGYIRAFYNASYTGEIDLADVYYYFAEGRYKTALKLNLGYIARLLLPAAVLYLPLVLFEVFSASIGGDFHGSVLYNDVFFILSALATTALFMYSLRYFIIFTIPADVENITAKQAFTYSRYVMKNNTAKTNRLVLSFIPWMLLCLLVLPALYVIPYMTQSLCISAKWMTKATFEVK